MTLSKLDPHTVVEELVACHEIRKALARYCRGLDRMDREMADGVWWPEATADYDGIYEGTGHGFIEWVWQAHARMDRHSHQITNVFIEADGDSARSESYVTVVLWTRPDDDGQQQEIVGRGRYLDRWERRAGRWAILERVHLLDMQTITPLVAGETSAGSARGPSDRSFGFFDA